MLYKEKKVYRLPISLIVFESFMQEYITNLIHSRFTCSKSDWNATNAVSRSQLKLYDINSNENKKQRNEKKLKNTNARITPKYLQKNMEFLMKLYQRIWNSHSMSEKTANKAALCYSGGCCCCYCCCSNPRNNIKNARCNIKTMNAQM